MRKREFIFLILLACLLCISLSGCKQKYSEDALLVKKAFEYLNGDNTDELISLVSDTSIDYKKRKKTLGGHIRAKNITIHVDSEYPNRVFFSCMLQGAATITINNVFSKTFSNMSSEVICKSISLEGSVGILTDPETGEKRIDISEREDPFSLCLNIAYNRLLDSPINLQNITTNEGFNTIVTTVAWIVWEDLKNIINDDNYISRIFVPDLSKLFENNKLESVLRVESSGLISEDETEIKIIDPPKKSQQKNTSIKADAEETEKTEKGGKGTITLIILGVILGFILIYRWIFGQKSEAKRLRIVEKTSKEKKLKKYALKDTSKKVRIVAVKRISDVIFLKNIALKDRSDDVRCAAIENITDEEFLEKVASQQNSKSIVRCTAIKKISHKDFLNGISLNDPDSSVRGEAVKKINDVNILKEVVLKDSNSSVCLDAFEKIQDEDFTKEIALKAQNSNVRKVAVINITDKAVLKEVALKDPVSDVRKEAVKKITNRTVLKTVALNDANWDVRFEAVKGITDETVLKEIVLNDTDSDVRREAVKKISDESILKEIVLTASDSYVRLIAVQKITDESVLKEVAQNDSDRDVRREAIEKITDEAVLKESVLKDSESDIRKKAFVKISDEIILEELISKSKDGEICKSAISRISRKEKKLLLTEHISIFLTPQEAVTLGNSRKNFLSFEFSNHTKTDKDEWGKTAVVFGEYAENKVNFYETTKSGWSLAALGRLITQNCTPEQFKKSLNSFENNVIQAYNKDCDKLKVLNVKGNRINEIDGILRSHGWIPGLGLTVGAKQLEDIKLEDEKKQLTKDYRDLENQLAPVIAKIERGILSYADNARVLPFGFFLQVINDSQGRFDRFIRQGAIMGMIDFFMKYQNDKIIHPHFENLIAARRDMISSDHQMSFFEVRAPKNCTAKEYAVILKEVLHCANPTINYCDTERLMEIAEQEIPGVMDLLVNYPLRLIDPGESGNETAEGFYDFEPYRHAMWVRYTPPLNVGQVQKRYHEVLDMTLPNSSGLNIRLFTNPYAAVPVMFHEYNHYLEDPNEASVFLKTHAFSLKFYRKYMDSEPEKDKVFIHLRKILGTVIDADKFQMLNDLILKYYGFPKSKEEAEAEAEADLQQKNLYVQYSNMQQNWCPDVKMPQLNDEGDKYNADLIRKIRIRYAQVPRTITKEEFRKRCTSYMSLDHSMYENYKELVPKMFVETKSDARYGKTVKRYGQWKSFKDWCVSQDYVKLYELVK